MLLSQFTYIFFMILTINSAEVRIRTRTSVTIEIGGGFGMVVLGPVLLRVF